MDLLATGRRLWQYLTAPRFAVEISGIDYNEVIEVTAGKKTKICTISVSLDYNGQLDRSRYARPLSNYCQCEKVHVTCENETWDNGRLVFEMFVSVTKVGFYSIVPEFPVDISYIRFTDGDQPVFPLQVKPSNTCSILLKNYVNSKPTHQDDRECGAPSYTSYRGDTVKIYVDLVDEFGNTYLGDDLGLHIVSDDQSLKVVYPATRDKNTGWYVISVRYQKAGTTIIQLSLQDDTKLNAQPLSQEVKVTPPPVSPGNCYIIQRDIDKIQKRTHEAGQPITFKLKLIDVFGNAISYGESKFFVKNIRPFFQDAAPEEDQDSSEESGRFTTCEKNSFTTNPSGNDSTACELSFTPYKAGKRLLVLSLREEDEQVENPRLSFDVNPGPLAKLHISHEPPSPSQNVLSSYSRQMRIVVMWGKDAFGNRVAMDPNKWYMLGDLKQEASVTTEKEGLAFKYSFDNPGAYKVDIKPKASMSRLTSFPSFEVEVAKAPLDFKMCVCECADQKPIFVGEPQCSSRIRVSVRDCIGHKYSLTAVDSEFRLESLSLDVDGEAWNVKALEYGTEDGEIYLTAVLDNEKVGIKFVQVLYDDQPLGEKVAMKIFGLQTYEANDFVRLYPNNKVIRCKTVCQGMLENLADKINLDNINRIVLEGKSSVVLRSSDIRKNTGGRQVVNLINVDLNNFESKTLLKFKEVISSWVEGIHYRNQANEFDREREKWKSKSMEAYFSKKHEEAKASSVIKERFATLMNQCHRRASDAIFDFYNKIRPQSEIDLHGQLVADPEKMEQYKQLLVRKSDKCAADIGCIIEREWQERDEAIRKLEERMRDFDHGKAKQDGNDWLEIIDGAGDHSARRGEQKIRPTVKEYLKKKNIRYVEANRGALLVTFSEYAGREPCVADFYCTKCKKSWISTASWKGFYQKCFACDSRRLNSECYPFKLRSTAPQRRRRSASSGFKAEDHVRLCQKCMQRGGDCRLRQ